MVSAGSRVDSATRAADPQVIPCAGRVYLIGFMGAGKSVVGRLLADRLACRFVDLDAVVESRTGCSITEIFAAHGEAEFRRLEHESLAETEEYDDVVVATGGGTVLFERNHAMIGRLGTSVWLNPSFETIVARLGADAHKERPLFRSTEQAQSLFEQRYPYYQRADLHIDMEASDAPTTVAAGIVKLLGRRPCGT